MQGNVGIDVDMRPLCDVSSDLTLDVVVSAAEQTLGVRAVKKPQSQGAGLHVPISRQEKGVNSWSRGSRWEFSHQLQHVLL